MRMMNFGSQALSISTVDRLLLGGQERLAWSTLASLEFPPIRLVTS